MIKEFKHKLANSKSGFKFGSMELKNNLINPVMNKVPLELENDYFKNEFNSLNFVVLKKRPNFKHADLIPVYLWSGFFCVSLRFKNIFQDKIKGNWYRSNLEDYFILVLNNQIDAIDKSKTTIIHKESGLRKPYQYEYIENLTFKKETENEYVFTIPELYGKFLASSKFENLVNNNRLIGFQFFKDINIRNKDGTEFDLFRRKKYDADGTCLE